MYEAFLQRILHGIAAPIHKDREEIERETVNGVLKEWPINYKHPQSFKFYKNVLGMWTLDKLDIIRNLSDGIY